MNPFIISSYGEPEFFCDRAKETGQIISAVNNEHNSFIHAITSVKK